MQTILLGMTWQHYVFAFVLFTMAVFLVGLILLQRGRGGGLTGALGGAGGQSAFGSKTGDVFTKVTIGAAFVWITTCVAADKILTTSSSGLFGPAGGSTKQISDDEKNKSNTETDGSSTKNSDGGSNGAFNDPDFSGGLSGLNDGPGSGSTPAEASSGDSSSSSPPPSKPSDETPQDPPAEKPN